MPKYKEELAHDDPNNLLVGLRLGDMDLDDAFGGAPLEFSLDPYAGFYYQRTPSSPFKLIADEEQIIQQIDSGLSTDVSDGVITYGFYVGNHAVGLNNNPFFGEGKGYTPYTDAQRDAAIEAANMWDDIIAPEFVNVGDVEVKDWAQQTVDIIMANTSTGPGQAWAYYPGYSNQYARVSSDIWTADPNYNWTNEWFGEGGYGTTTMIHEMGHAIGLSHPGNYNGAGATDYDNQAEYAQDSMQYTIMSYWSGGSTGAVTVNWNLLFNNYAQTPMIHDILVAQNKYGAEMDTRTGDTVYGFNSNAGYAVFDFSQNDFPYLAIWDAGGNDTIDLSGYTASQFLNLHAGSFSSVGAAIPDAATINANMAEFNEMHGTAYGEVSQGLVDFYVAILGGRIEAKIEFFTGVDGVYASSYDNFGIAYGVTIENGIGGQGRDVIWGNEVANILDGQNGDDVIVGYEGDDTLIGGLGNDELTGSEGADTFAFSDLEMGDLITDFDGSEGDMIDLSGLVDDADAPLSFIADAAFSNTAGEVRYDQTTGELMMDGDGDGAADFIVTLANQADVDASMLVLAAGG